MSLGASTVMGVAMGVALQDTVYPWMMPLRVAGTSQLASREDEVLCLRSKFKGALGTAIKNRKL